MRKAVLLVGVLALGGVIALSALNQDAKAAYGKSCLTFRNLDGLKKVDDRTYLASTKYGKGKYVVKFRSACHSLDKPDNPYSVRLYSDGECFDGDDVLQFRYGGPCFIESVTPAAQ